MRLRFLRFGVAAAALLAVTAAKAAGYVLVFSGPDFTIPGIGVQTVALPAPVTGWGNPWVPLQTWSVSGVSGPSVGGWIDFFTDGVTTRFEGVSYTSPSDPLFLVAGSAFYALTPTGGTTGSPNNYPIYGLTFPGATPGSPEIVTLTNLAVNDGIDNANYGKADTLTIYAVPEPSTWALMGLGFAGLGASGWIARRRRLQPAGA